MSTFHQRSEAYKRGHPQGVPLRARYWLACATLDGTHSWNHGVRWMRHVFGGGRCGGAELQFLVFSFLFSVEHQSSGEQRRLAVDGRWVEAASGGVDSVRQTRCWGRVNTVGEACFWRGALRGRSPCTREAACGRPPGTAVFSSQFLVFSGTPVARGTARFPSASARPRAWRAGTSP